MTLEEENVYSCLVCGKYFQARNRASPAFVHSLDSSHHLYLNLRTERVYCLPDGYQVVDPSFTDITMALNPKFVKQDVELLDIKPKRFRTLNGEMHVQGVTGLNNLGSTGYVNVVLQTLGVVSPLRNYLLLNENASWSSLVSMTSEILRKVWNPAAFRGQVSPEVFVQKVVLASDTSFNVSKEEDPVGFFAWLLHAMHRGLRKSEGKKLIKTCFQGEMAVKSVRDTGNGKAESKRYTSKFYFLSLDLPSKPLFKDSLERALVPQVSLATLLEKYNGTSEHHVVKTGERLSFVLTKLPMYLVFNIKRVSRNKFTSEKNPAVVHFPLEDLHMGAYLPETISKEKSTSYDLIAAIFQDGSVDDLEHRVVVKQISTGVWHEFQDLKVKVVQSQLIALSEAHALMYRRRRDTSTGEKSTS